MVSTRRSPQKKTRPTGVPTLSSGQARVRPERAEQRTEQQSAAARANAPAEEAHRPIEEEELSQLDIVDDDDVYHGKCVGSKTMDVDDDEEEQKVDEEEEEQGGGDVLGTVVLSRKCKLALKDTDLCTFFFNQLERMSCPSRSCGCLAIVHDLNARSAIVKYLTWFERRHKHEQDSIVFEWVRYVLILKASYEQRKGMKNGKVFCLPFVDDGTDDGTDAVVDKVRTYLLCKRGLVSLFDELARVLDQSATVTVHQTVANDLFDYDKLLDGIYRKLAGHIKQNHIFSCEDDGSEMMIRKSNLVEHQEYILCIWKKNWAKVGWTEMIEYAEKVLRPIMCVGLNPYKMVEMFKNYHPVFQSSFIRMSCMQSRVQKFGRR